MISTHIFTHCLFIYSCVSEHKNVRGDLLLTVAKLFCRSAIVLIKKMLVILVCVLWVCFKITDVNFEVFENVLRIVKLNKFLTIAQICLFKRKVI